MVPRNSTEMISYWMRPRGASTTISSPTWRPKRAGHGREHRDAALGGFGLVRAEQGVFLDVAGFGVFDLHRGPEGDGLAIQGVQIDDVEDGHARLDVVDAGFEHALTFAGGVVARVFLEVAFFAGFLDGLDDFGPFLLEAVELDLEPTESFNGNGNAAHVLVLSRTRGVPGLPQPRRKRGNSESRANASPRG